MERNINQDYYKMDDYMYYDDMYYDDLNDNAFANRYNNEFNQRFDNRFDRRYDNRFDRRDNRDYYDPMRYYRYPYCDRYGRCENPIWWMFWPLFFL